MKISFKTLGAVAFGLRRFFCWKMFLIIVDAYSKWIDIRIHSTATSKAAWCRRLPLMTCLNRLCQTMDCASQVRSFAHFSAKMQFNRYWWHHFTPPFQWPSGASGSVVKSSYEQMKEEPLHTIAEGIVIPLLLSLITHSYSVQQKHAKQKAIHDLHFGQSWM